MPIAIGVHPVHGKNKQLFPTTPHLYGNIQIWKKTDLNKSYMRKFKLWVMKNFGFKEILVFGGIIYLIITKINIEKRIDRIIENPGYSIGTVTKYLSEGSGYIGVRLNSPRRNGFMDYHFYLDRKMYVGSLDGSMEKFPSEGEFLGKQFLVAYNKDNPLESRIMFEMPVTDSIDFQRHIEKLESENHTK